MTSDQKNGYWDALDRLVETFPVVIDRPAGTHHPRYPEIIYPLNYGYLDGTSSSDGGGIDVWLGNSGERELSAVVLTVDLLKNDTEIKLLLGCIEGEIQTILRFHTSGLMQAELVRRPKKRGEK
jgi:inorganic pyrophosphatase